MKTQLQHLDNNHIDPALISRTFLLANLGLSDDSVEIYNQLVNIKHNITLNSHIDINDSIDGYGFLYYAIKLQQIDLIEIMKENSADFDVKLDGQHPLLFCWNTHRARGGEFMLEMIENGCGKLTGNINNKEILSVIISIKEAAAISGDYFDEEAILNSLLSSGAIEHKDLFSHKNQPSQHLLYDFAKTKIEYNKEKLENRKHQLRLLLDSGPYRTFRQTPGINDIDSLYESFPNFSSVIDQVKRNIALYSLSEKVGGADSLRVDPILLYGQAGIGKTLFFKKLTSLINYEFFKISCGTITAGWVIGGSSTGWSEGRAGYVHNYLRDAQSANPFFMLDEIDKLTDDSRYNGYGALYDLLEETSSSKFTDESVSICIDASKVSWIATANDISKIPVPILSRFHCIEIKLPEDKYIHAIASSVLKEVLDEQKSSWGSLFSGELTSEVVALLKNMSPRDIRLVLKRSLGLIAMNYTNENALFNAKSFEPLHISYHDVEESMVKESKRSIGF